MFRYKPSVALTPIISSKGPHGAGCWIYGAKPKRTLNRQEWKVSQYDDEDDWAEWIVENFST